MRIPRWFLAALAVIIIVAPGLHAGSKVGVLLKGRSNFWSAVEKGALEAGEKAGAEVIVKAPLSESDVSVQVQLLNALVAQGIEALVIASTNKDSLSGPLAAVSAKGVKIVAIDSPSGLKDEPVFVGTDHRAAGEAAGALIASLVGAEDEVTFLKHNQNGGAALMRETGALAKLREVHPKIPVRGDIYASTEKNAELAKAKLVFATYPQTKAVLASGTPGTMAMLAVLKENQAPGAVKFVGFGFNLNADVAAAIEGGVMHGWIAQQPKEVGVRGVEAAFALLKGETVAPVVTVDFLAITKDNLKDPKVQALLTL